MPTSKNRESTYGLDQHKIRNIGQVYWNLRTGALIEEAIRRREGLLASNGSLLVSTGQHTGRSPNDKFVVRESTTEDQIWWGDVNEPFEEEQFDQLYGRMTAYLQGKDLFVQDCWAGADPKYRIPIRIITEDAWHNLFARQLFIPDETLSPGDHKPQFTVINAPKFQAIPEQDGTRSEAFVIINFGQGLIIVGGTSYAGEIKKSIFTVMNYLLPLQNVLSMHCGANKGADGDVALFFGLSGTGKTTLSADPDRQLIGDDEHGWSEDGIFNFEGGCYAKCIRLSQENEPQIWNAIRFGTVLENVIMNTELRRLDFDDDSLTENTRAAYPVAFIDKAIFPGIAGQPANILLLTCDAFGVLPPISKLTPEQAMYHFLSGYTAKVAGTEKGMGNEPQATFSTCFGKPFLPLHPTVYANLMREKIAKHNVNCWLVNTGWSGGSYGVGERMNLPHTRAMVSAALDGSLASAEYATDPIFGLSVPKACPNVPSEVLNPKGTWKDPAEYDSKARDLADRFVKNIAHFSDVSDEIVAAGPKVG